MGALRKLRKQIKNSQAEPMILVVPDASDTYTAFAKTLPDVITITDRTIYKRMRDAVEHAMATGGSGVSRGQIDEPDNTERRCDKDDRPE